MVKKLFLSAVTIGALATSAMAYNIDELSDMSPTRVNTNEVNQTKNNNWSDIIVKGFNQKTTSNALIFPAYFVGNGWETHLRVINTDSNGVVAKVVFYAGTDSHEVVDFNIYLSPNDVWTGTLKVDDDGVAKLISTDGSAPLEDGSMASVENPLKKTLDVQTGYVEVIAMAETNQTKSTYKDGHEDHAGLRKAYTEFANLMRTGKKDPDLIWQNGVIQNKVASYPYLDINFTKLKGQDIDKDGKIDYNLTPLTTYNILTGDVRITDTVNGKDMVLPAYKVDYTITNKTKFGTNYAGDALIYLEGEKANLADIEIDTNGKDYNFTNLQTDINSISTNKVYLTYGDAAPQNMVALITNPFKRLYVQSGLDDADGSQDAKISNGSKAVKLKNLSSATYYTNAQLAQAAPLSDIDYGSFKLVAQIYDENEKLSSASMFSPATTPTIELKKEVSSTGNSLTDKDSLANYLNQAGNNGFKKGFVKLTNAKGSSIKIPGIVTQMIATTAAGKTITNWIEPQR